MISNAKKPLRGGAAFTHGLKEYSGGVSMKEGLKRYGNEKERAGMKKGFQLGINYVFQRMSLAERLFGPWSNKWQ